MTSTPSIFYSYVLKPANLFVASINCTVIVLIFCHLKSPVCLVRCSTASSRLAAYEVLVMLADSSLSNLQLITRELLSMHHQSDPSLCKEFDVRHLLLKCNFMK